MAKGRLYSEDEDAFIREHYAHIGNPELVRMMREHGWERSPKAVEKRAKQLGVRKADRRECFRHQRIWTDEEREWIAEHGPGRTAQQVADMFAERFGRQVRAGQVARCMYGMGVRMGYPQRWKKGHVPWNAGERLDEYVTEDGYTYVRVDPRDAKDCHGKWVSKCKLEWCRHNARDWPEGHMCVFADGDRENFDPENLVAVPSDIYPMTQRFGHCDRDTTEMAMTSARISQAIDRIRYPYRHKGER